ncbi:MAG: MarC family protein [Candidatus Omnitrophota bacterium]
MSENFLLAFIPIFVAVDALGVLPIFISLVSGLSKKEKIFIIKSSVVTAMVIALVFVAIGKFIFKFLGITIADFMIAGGVLLFIIAINDILNPEKKTRIPSATMGAVPLGMPLIVGPAVLTTTLIIVSQYGIEATTLSLVANILLAGVVFFFADSLIRILGVASARAVSKVASLLLAAIAIMFVRRGVLEIVSSYLKSSG